MNYNEIVKKLLELETLNKLKVININSNKNSVEVEVKGERRYVIIINTRCVGGKDIDIIKIEERKYIEDGEKYVDKIFNSIVLFSLEQLEEYLNTIELTYEEKIKSKIIEILDKEILFGKQIANRIEERNGNGYYTSSINGDAFRIETVFNDNKTIEIIFTYKDEVEKLHLECETNKKTNSAYIIYDKFVNDISVIRYSIYDNVYDINILSRFFKLIFAVSNSSYFGNLMYLVGEAIIEDPNKKKGETLRDVLNKK